MAHFDTSLDAHLIPKLYYYDYDFGTMKAGGGLTTAEVARNIAMVFQKMRAVEIKESSTTTKIEYNANFVVTRAYVTLTLGKPKYRGCCVDIRSVIPSGYFTVEYAGETGTVSQQVNAGESLCLVCRDGDTFAVRQEGGGSGDSTSQVIVTRTGSSLKTYSDIYYDDDTEKWYSDSECKTEVFIRGKLVSWNTAEHVMSDDDPPVETDVIHYTNAVFEEYFVYDTLSDYEEDKDNVPDGATITIRNGGQYIKTGLNHRELIPNLLINTQSVYDNSILMWDNDGKEAVAVEKPTLSNQVLTAKIEKANEVYAWRIGTDENKYIDWDYFEWNKKTRYRDSSYYHAPKGREGKVATVRCGAGASTDPLISGVKRYYVKENEQYYEITKLEGTKVTHSETPISTDDFYLINLETTKKYQNVQGNAINNLTRSLYIGTDGKIVAMDSHYVISDQDEVKGLEEYADTSARFYIVGDDCYVGEDKTACKKVLGFSTDDFTMSLSDTTTDISSMSPTRTDLYAKNTMYVTKCSVFGDDWDGNYDEDLYSVLFEETKANEVWTVNESFFDSNAVQTVKPAGHKGIPVKIGKVIAAENPWLKALRYGGTFYRDDMTPYDFENNEDQDYTGPYGRYVRAYASDHQICRLTSNEKFYTKVEDSYYEVTGWKFMENSLKIEYEDSPITDDALITEIKSYSMMTVYTYLFCLTDWSLKEKYILFQKKNGFYYRLTAISDSSYTASSSAETNADFIAYLNSLEESDLYYTLYIVKSGDVTYEWNSGGSGSVSRFATMAEAEAAIAIAEGQDGYIPINGIVIVDEEDSYIEGENL